MRRVHLLLAVATLAAAGLTMASATAAQATQAEAPHVVETVDCGGVELEFVNPTDWLFVFDYRVDGEAAVSSSPFAPLVIGEGPLAGQAFGDRWHLVSIAGPGSDTVTITFDEDSTPDPHIVQYRLAEGAEQNLYFDWVTVYVADCEPEPTPTAT